MSKAVSRAVKKVKVVKQGFTEQELADLGEALEAAGKWADDLDGDIAFESEMDGDEESAEGYRERAATIRASVNRLSLTFFPQTCAWFANCENPATTFLPHPILGDVATCQHCADRVERMK